MSWWSRLTNVFRAGRVDRDLADELQFHMDERIRALMADGMSRDAAAAQVARRFGTPLRWREQSRDVKLLPWLDSLLRDVRVGLRMLRKNAVVTGAALASLSLALGACVAAFSLVDALVLRPLPLRQPERLVYVAFPSYSADRPETDTFNDPLFVRLREAGRGRVDLFAMSTQVMRPVIFAGAGGEKEPVRTQYVSGDAFDRLGVSPAAGRLIAPRDDERSGGEPVAVLSHAYWQRRFGGDAGAVGQWFTLGERQFQIVGVAARAFPGVEPGRPTDVWFPYATYNPRAFGNRQFNWFRIMGRLTDGASPEQAQSVLQVAFSNFRREFSQRSAGLERSAQEYQRFLQTPVYLRSAANGPSPLRREFERPLWILAAIAGLVLLIAGSNLANLFLARTAAREREMALRISIGAGRRRLIQQLLVESALLAGAASAIGILFATVAGPAVVSLLAPPEDPVHLDLQLTWRLAAVAGGLTLLTTALFGLAPAIRASGIAPIVALKTGSGRSGTRARLMQPFVAMQVAFGLIVLFVGSLLVSSFARLAAVHPGFATTNVLLISLDTVRPSEAAELRPAVLGLLDRLRTVPGVQAATSVEYNLFGRAWTHMLKVPGTERDYIDTTMLPVADGFFETMTIPVLAGRPFERRDLASANATAIVVSEAFARRYYADGAAVGRTVEAAFGDSNNKGAHEIIGVVADTRHNLRKPPVPTIYIPMRMHSAGTIQARVSGDVAALSLRLRDEVRAANPLFRVTTIKPQSAVIDQTVLRERLLALLAGFFAAVGLVLAAVGLYGVLSYSVVQRTPEIGIRVALGAGRAGVVRAVLIDASVPVLAGAICGLAGGLYLSRFVEALLFEVRALDFWSLGLPLALLALTAAMAAALPALRASRVDPMAALRCE